MIDALNRDLPYDQFLIEQIAGDLLPGATQEQIIATGFLRNSMINEEGAIVPEQFRMVEMFDRMDCLGKAVLGLTHAVRPVPLAQVRSAHARRILRPVRVPEQHLRGAVVGLHAGAAAADRRDPAGASSDAEERLRAAAAAVAAGAGGLGAERSLAQQAAWEPLIATELGSISGLNHPTQEADKSLLMKGHTSDDVFMIAAPDAERRDRACDWRRSTTATCRTTARAAAAWARGASANWKSFVKKPDGKDWEKLKLVNATADFSEPEQKQADGKKASGPVAYLIDGKDDTTWNADRGIGRRNQPSVAVVQFEKPLNLPGGDAAENRLADDRHARLLPLRASRGSPLPRRRRSITPRCWPCRLPPASATAEQQAAVFAAWRTSAGRRRSRSTTRSTRSGSTYPAGGHVDPAPGRARAGQPPRDASARPRQLGPAAARRRAAHAGRVSSVPGRRAAQSAGLRPLAGRSPLAADGARGRERVWQAMFGTGLVETAEDFGTRAPVPEHRELLDWLAVDFMEHGWSQKHLIRTIVTSATYRQVVRGVAELLERDPRNVWLARGPRFRAEAEVVRDIALSVVGADHAQARRPERHSAGAAERAGLQLHLPGLLEAGRRARALSPHAVRLPQAVDARPGDVELRRARTATSPVPAACGRTRRWPR